MSFSKPIALRVFAFCAMIVGHGFIGYFNSGPAFEHMSAAGAIAFWALELCSIAAVIFWLRTRTLWPMEDLWLYSRATLKVALIATLILAVPLTLIDYVFGVNDQALLLNADKSAVSIHLASEVFEEAVLLFVPCVVAITMFNWLLPVGVFAEVVQEFPAPTEEADTEKSKPLSIPPFWRKVTRYPHAELIALEAQQHYIMVHTSLGEELIHYRFGQAVEELNEHDGIMVHRSYWISRTSIEGIVSKGRNSFALLRSGQKIPISRSKKQEVIAQLQETMGTQTPAA